VVVFLLLVNCNLFDIGEWSVVNGEWFCHGCIHSQLTIDHSPH
jgi:hypothetical protein